jgi:hypothetical protein
MTSSVFRAHIDDKTSLISDAPDDEKLTDGALVRELHRTD